VRLLEFALRGVRRFEGGRKLAFQEGYNLVTGPNDSGKSTLLAALLATLEPERLREDATGVLAGPQPGEPAQARGGLTFLHDGKTYRLVRDLEQGAATLAALEPGSSKYLPQQRDAESVRAWLREVAGMPGPRQFDVLLVISRASMPSARAPGLGSGPASPGRRPEDAGVPEFPRRVEAAAASAEAPAFEITAPAGPTLTGPARASRIAELKAELGRIEEMGRIEFRLDGVKAKLFEVEAEFGDLRKLDQLAAELDAAIAAFERLGVDPEQLEARARTFKTLSEKRSGDLAAVEAEREALGAAVSVPARPVFKDPLVLGGGAAAVASLVIGVWFPLAAVGALAGLGAALLGAVRDAQAAGRQKAALDALQRLDGREQTIEKRFDIETKAVRAAQETLGVAGPEGLLERIGEYRALKTRRAEVAARREALTRQKNLEALEAERRRLAAEVAELEEALRGFGGTAAFDAGELKRELNLLEGRVKPERPAQAAPLETEGDGGGPAAGDGPGALDAAVGAWLEAAARLAGRPRDALARDVLQRAQPLVAPLTTDRFKSLAFDAAGRLVAVGADGRSVPAAGTSPGTQDVVFLALRLAGHTLLARDRSWPLFLDDPLVALDDARLQVACLALKRVARAAGQVIHLSARKLPPALADSVQSL
jgi:DNA repair exonuclease SbcCD ATPase subunit